jgi:hypothetical protein
LFSPLLRARNQQPKVNTQKVQNPANVINEKEQFLKQKV